MLLDNRSRYHNIQRNRFYQGRTVTNTPEEQRNLNTHLHFLYYILEKKFKQFVVVQFLGGSVDYEKGQTCCFRIKKSNKWGLTNRFPIRTSYKSLENKTFKVHHIFVQGTFLFVYLFTMHVIGLKIQSELCSLWNGSWKLPIVLCHCHLSPPGQLTDQAV